MPGRKKKGTGTGSGSSVNPEYRSIEEMQRRAAAGDAHAKAELKKYHERRDAMLARGSSSNLEAVVENMTDPKKMK